MRSAVYDKFQLHGIVYLQDLFVLLRNELRIDEHSVSTLSWQVIHHCVVGEPAKEENPEDMFSCYW